MPQSNTNTCQLEIVVSIPSITIFYPDLTYSFSDCAREYDALIIAKIHNHPLILLGEEVSDFEESGKVVIDLSLWHPPVLYIFDKTTKGRYYEEFLVPLRLFTKNASLTYTIQLNQMAHIWMNGYELFNLLFYSLLFTHYNTSRKILNDISSMRYPQQPSLNILSELSTCLKSIIENNTVPTLDKINSPKYMNIDAPKTASDIIAELATKEMIVYFFPQLLKEYEKSEKRKYFPINLAVLILNVLSEKVNKLYFRVIGTGPGTQYSEYILKEIKNLLVDFEINCNIKGIISRNLDETKSLLVEDAHKIASETNTPSILIIVAGDYGKRPFAKLVANIASAFRKSELTILVFPEVIYKISKKKENRLASMSAPLNTVLKKNEKKEGFSQFESFLEKDILLIKSKEASRLIDLLTQLVGEHI